MSPTAADGDVVVHACLLCRAGQMTLIPGHRRQHSAVCVEAVGETGPCLSHWQKRRETRKNGRLRQSASDVVDFLACSHLTRLDVLNARGKLKPPYAFESGFEELVRRGEVHEKG